MLPKFASCFATPGRSTNHESHRKCNKLYIVQYWMEIKVYAYSNMPLL